MPRRYQSEGSLFRTKCMFLEILETAASSLWDMNYTVKNVVFELIFRLLKRSELSDLSSASVIPRLRPGEGGPASQEGGRGVRGESAARAIVHSQRRAVARRHWARSGR